jgi:HSP20 family molecular chaperone IbpA
MAPDQTKQAEVVAATDVAEEAMRPQTVPVNVYETDAAVVVVAPLPAVQPSDVTIDVTPGHMRITAALRSAAPREYLVHEWHYGGFEREVDIPAGFGATVEASLANGQLAVRALKGDPAGKVTVVPADPSEHVPA